MDPRVSLLLALRWDTALLSEQRRIVRQREERAAAQLRAAAEEAPAAPVPPATCVVAGEVRDQGGAALPDSSVELTTSSATLATVTNRDGHFSFTCPCSPADAQLVASAFGYRPQVVLVVLSADAPALVLPPLSPEDAGHGSLRVEVRDYDGTPRAAELRLRAITGGPEHRARTDAGGKLELALPVGRYRVVITAGGHHSYHGDVTIASSAVSVMHVDVRGRR